jgi:hypothetical protein
MSALEWTVVVLIATSVVYDVAELVCYLRRDVDALRALRIDGRPAMMEGW